VDFQHQNGTALDWYSSCSKPPLPSTALGAFSAWRSAARSIPTCGRTRNQTEAAERFLIPLSTFNQKIKRLEIDVRRRGRGDEMLSASIGK